MFNFFKTLFSPIVAILDFISKYFFTIVFLTIVYFIVSSGDESSGDFTTGAPNLQKIVLEGPIEDVEKVLEQINDAKKNDDIKGVLFEVNSPGGAVAPSIEVAYAIKELKELKPVVAYASGTIASGSYYASIWADKIIANPGSMVGSIGVIFQGANIEKLMEKIGVEPQTVKIGKYKEAGTFSRDWNTYEKEELEKVIVDTYDMFVSDVADARGLKREDHEIYADAHIFTARQAKEVGLVDEVATISFAKELLINESGVEEAVWMQEDKFDKFMDRFINEAITNISQRFMDGLKAY